MDLSGIKTHAEFVRFVVANGGRITGGPVPSGLASGWAVHPFNGNRAHHWRVGRAAGGAVGVYTTCGLRTCVTDQVQLLEPGNYELCSRCDVALLKKRV